jgi:hypothetical protein
MEFAKGTVVIISKILESFIKKRRLGNETLGKLIYYEAILEELGKYEKTLLDELYTCYKKHKMIVRQKDGEPISINTPHIFDKYLAEEDLKPLYLPLKERMKKD